MRGSLFLLTFTGLLSATLPGCSSDDGPGKDDGGTGPSNQGVASSDRILRRLTRFEYDNTVSDLLNIPSSFGQGLPPAISGHNNYYLWGPRGHDGSVLIIIGKMVRHTGDTAMHIAAAQFLGGGFFAGSGFDQRRSA